MNIGTQKHNLLKNTAIYTITGIISSAIPMLLLPILTRTLSPQDYGLISMFTLLVALASPFIGLSVNGAIYRQYYNQEETDIWVYVFNCILVLLVSTFAIGIVFYVFSNIIERLTSFPAHFLGIVIVYCFSQFIVSIILTLWRLQNKAILFGIFNNFLTIFNVGLSIIFVLIVKMGWSGRIYGQTIAMLIFALIAMLVLIRRGWVKASFSKAYIYNALLFGIPLIPHALSGSIISMTDRFFITNMVGLDATGIYTVGYQIGSIINLLAVSFNNAYVPWLFEELKSDNYKTKVKIIKLTYLYFVLITFLAIFLGLIAPIILNIILGQSFSESSAYVIWVAIGYAFNGMYLMVVNYIFFAQKTKILAYVTLATAIANIPLNYFFIKAFGAIGAAEATAVVFGIKFVLVWILSSRVQPMPWNLRSL